MTETSHEVLKSPTTWLFVQQLAEADSKDNFKVPPYLPFKRGMFLWPMDFRNKILVTRKAFLYHKGYDTPQSIYNEGTILSGTTVARSVTACSQNTLKVKKKSLAI